MAEANENFNKLGHRCIKDQSPYQDPKPQSGTSKASNKDLNDMDVLCAFKIKTESQNLEHGCVKDQ